MGCFAKGRPGIEYLQQANCLQHTCNKSTTWHFTWQISCHGFSRYSHTKLQYTVFCLLAVYLVITSLCLSHDSISHMLVKQSLYSLNSFCIAVVVERNGKNTCSHGNCSVQRRSSLQRAELIYYVTQSPRGSWTQSRHSGTGPKLIGHLRLRQFGAHVHTWNDVLERSTLQTVTPVTPGATWRT